MSADLRRKHTVCSGCGAAMAKAHAVHDGNGFCHSCYYRLFKPGPCAGCGKTTRSFGGAGPAFCRTCRTRGRTCARCGKDVPSAALVIENGVACPSCARYFREPQECPSCGLSSFHLARDFRNGFSEPVCQRCRRSGHVNCPVCGKNRLPAGVGGDGRMVCRVCLETDGTPFVCPTCGREGKRHSSTSCVSCYWRDYAGKKVGDAVSRLRSGWVRDTFLRFSEEMLKRVEPQKAALRTERYFVFFAILDGAFDAPETLTEKEMVSLFGVEGLRRQAVPYGFLKKERIIHAEDGERDGEAAERLKQAAVLAKAAGTFYEPLLREYLEHLRTISIRYRERGWAGERSRFLPRTVTGNLRAAERFLAALDPSVSAVQQIDQAGLDKFLAGQSGGRNGIRSFVRFLNVKKKLFRKIAVTTIPTNLPRGLFLDHRQYARLLQTWLNPEENLTKESLICALIILYAQQVRKLVRMRLSDLCRGEDGLYRVVFGRTEISLDRRVGDLLDRYLADRKALATMEEEWENEYLFTGRSFGRHLSEAAVTHYLKKYGVTAETLFASALFYAYLTGMRHPKVLVNALGITDTTAMKYVEIINLRLRGAAERHVAGV